MKSRKALVFGASGLVGGHLISVLSEAGYEEVISFGRRELPFKSHGFKQITIEFDQLDKFADKIKGTDVFCCLGTTIKKAGSKEQFYKVDYLYVYNLAKIAKANGAKRFLLVSSSGANANSKIFYTKVKGEIENAVKLLGYEQVHIFRPSLLLGNRSERRPAERIGQIIGGSLGFLFAGRLKRYKPIQAKQVANAMLIKAFSEKSGIYVYESDEIAATY